MIKGIGLDLIETARIEKALENSRFIERVFTPLEIELLHEQNSPERAAGMFAAKEAVVKALGTGFGKVKWTDVEVLREDSGAPFVVLHNYARSLLGENDRVLVSITNIKDMASAVAITEG